MIGNEFTDYFEPPFSETRESAKLARTADYYFYRNHTPGSSWRQPAKRWTKEMPDE